MSGHSKRRNLIFITLGIFIGLLLGGVFGWWIKPEKIIQTIITPVKNFSFLSPFGLDKNDSTSLAKSIKYPVTGSSSHHYNQKDSLTDTTNYDILYPDLVVDSITSDEASEVAFDEKNITIKKDELLFVKEMELIAKSGKDNGLDSLLIDEEVKASKKTVRVEFWRSPINYHGYSFSQNKLTVFGIYDLEETYLFNFNNVVYLKNFTDIYILEQSGDFRPLKKINNPALYKQLSIR